MSERTDGGWAQRLMAGAAVTLLIGGITQGVLVYSSSQVMAAEIVRLREDVKEIKDDLKTRLSDRWTKSDHAAYAAKVEARPRRLESK